MSTTPALPRRKLPISIQNLREIRARGCYYVDKSGLAIDLIESAGKAVFLSRPRRFGKSLLVDTFKELFEGNQPLFAGLAAETRWDWSSRHPVIRISFGGGTVSDLRSLDHRIRHNLRTNRLALGLQLADDIPDDDLAGHFADLIAQAHARHGASVVVLVDEYDKPILDNLTQPDLAREVREQLKNFYQVLKESDQHLRFVFLTGVSKFSKVSLFSGLNHLQDITLTPPLERPVRLHRRGRGHRVCA
jgi:hypothetical protein